MSKKNLLCLIPGEEVKGFVLAFFVKLEFEVEFLDKDLSSVPDEKFLKYYGLIINESIDILSLQGTIGKYPLIKLISFGNYSDLVTFVSFNGRYIVDPLWSKYEWSFPYWKKLLHSESSIHLQEYLGNGVKSIKNKKLFNFFKVGIQVDEIIVSLANLKINFVAVRSFIDHLFLFAEIEKNKNLGNLPIELEYKATENGFFLLANFFSKPIDQEHFIQYFEAKKSVSPEDGLLLLCAKLCDSFSVTHDQEKKLTTVTALWVQKLKNQVIETPSLVFEIFKSQKTEKRPIVLSGEQNSQQVDWAKNHSVEELEGLQEELSHRTIPTTKSLEVGRTDLDDTNLKEIFFNDREQMRQITEFALMNFDLEKPGVSKTQLDSNFLLKVIKNYPYFDEVPKDMNEIDYARLAQMIIKEAWTEIGEEEILNEVGDEQIGDVHGEEDVEAEDVVDDEAVEPLQDEKLEDEEGIEANLDIPEEQTSDESNEKLDKDSEVAKVEGKAEDETDEHVAGKSEKDKEAVKKIKGKGDELGETKTQIEGAKEELTKTLSLNKSKKSNDEDSGMAKFLASMTGDVVDSQNMVTMLKTATKQSVSKSDLSKFIATQKLPQDENDELLSVLLTFKVTEIDQKEFENATKDLKLKNNFKNNVNEFFKLNSTPIIDVDKMAKGLKQNQVPLEKINLVKEYLVKKNSETKESSNLSLNSSSTSVKSQRQGQDGSKNDIKRIKGKESEEVDNLKQLVESLKEENLEKDEVNSELIAQKINKELNIDQIKNTKIELTRDEDDDHFINKISDKISNGGSLEKSDAKDIMKIFAKEREFQDRARELEKQHRLALMAFDKKDALYKNELDDYKRKVKQKDLLLKQAHEGIQASQAQKEKSVNLLERTIRDLKQQTSQNSISKLESKIQLLDRDKKSMLKTIEMYKEKLAEINRLNLQNSDKQNLDHVNYKEIATRSEATKKRLEVKSEQLEAEKTEMKKDLFHKDDLIRKLNAQSEILNKRVLMAELKMKEALDTAKEASAMALKDKVVVKDAGLSKLQEQLTRTREEARNAETELRKEMARKEESINLIKKNLLNETNKVKILEDKIKELDDKAANSSKNGVGAEGKNSTGKPESSGTMLKMAEEAKKKLMKDLQDQSLKLAESKKEADKMKRTAAELQAKLSAAEAELGKLKKASGVSPVKDNKEVKEIKENKDIPPVAKKAG
ncbi:MAG: hypothetical protein QE271_00530 [Bacteriovoracaceae bacterium]|nr:hypothetical protein [Bacteriovoracaceae bacterium]